MTHNQTAQPDNESTQENPTAGAKSPERTPSEPPEDITKRQEETKRKILGNLWEGTIEGEHCTVTYDQSGINIENEFSPNLSIETAEAPKEETGFPEDLDIYYTDYGELGKFRIIALVGKDTGLRYKVANYEGRWLITRNFSQTNPEEIIINEEGLSDEDREYFKAHPEEKDNEDIGRYKIDGAKARQAILESVLGLEEALEDRS